MKSPNLARVSSLDKGSKAAKEHRIGKVEREHHLLSFHGLV